MQKPVGELLPGREFIQVFRVEGAELTVVRPMLATYARPVGGELEISLHRVTDAFSALRPWSWISRLRGQEAAHLRIIKRSLKKEPLAKLKIAGEQIIDNERVDLSLPRGTVCSGEIVALRIAASGVTRNNAPTVWTASAPDRISGHLSSYFNDTALGEYGLYGYQTYYPAEISSDIPRSILYSPITQCNLNCIHCISRYTRKSLNRLPIEIKDRIRSWAADGKLVSLSSDYSGDILWADHRFGGELAFVLALNIPFRVDTNGVYLTAEASERLSRSKVINVNVSLDAARDDTYRRVRKGAPPLRDVLSNVAELISIRDKAGAHFPITLGFTLMVSTLGEWDEFIQLAAILGVDAINTSHLHAYTADMEPESLWHTPGAFNRARLQAIELAASLGLPMGVPPPFHTVQEVGHRFCNVPWVSAAILGNGDVAACCVPGTVMGNLHEQSMEEIWTGPRYRAFRAKVNSDTPPRPCSFCPMVRRVGNRGSYLQYSARRMEDGGLGLAGSISPNLLSSDIDSSP